MADRSTPPLLSRKDDTSTPRQCSRGHNLSVIDNKQRTRCTCCINTFKSSFGYCHACDYVACPACMGVDLLSIPSPTSTHMSPRGLTSKKSSSSSSVSSRFTSPKTASPKHVSPAPVPPRLQALHGFSPVGTPVFSDPGNPEVSLTVAQLQRSNSRESPDEKHPQPVSSPSSSSLSQPNPSVACQTSAASAALNKTPQHPQPLLPAALSTTMNPYGLPPPPDRQALQHLNPPPVPSYAPPQFAGANPTKAPVAGKIESSTSSSSSESVEQIIDPKTKSKETPRGKDPSQQAHHIAGGSVPHHLQGLQVKVSSTPGTQPIHREREKKKASVRDSDSSDSSSSSSEKQHSQSGAVSTGVKQEEKSPSRSTAPKQVNEDAPQQQVSGALLPYHLQDLLGATSVPPEKKSGSSTSDSSCSGNEKDKPKKQSGQHETRPDCGEQGKGKPGADMDPKHSGSKVPQPSGEEHESKREQEAQDTSSDNSDSSSSGSDREWLWRQPHETPDKQKEKPSGPMQPLSGPSVPHHLQGLQRAVLSRPASEAKEGEEGERTSSRSDSSNSTNGRRKYRHQAPTSKSEEAKPSADADLKHSGEEECSTIPTKNAEGKPKSCSSSDSGIKRLSKHETAAGKQKSKHATSNEDTLQHLSGASLPHHLQGLQGTLAPSEMLRRKKTRHASGSDSSSSTISEQQEQGHKKHFKRNKNLEEHATSKRDSEVALPGLQETEDTRHISDSDSSTSQLPGIMSGNKDLGAQSTQSSGGTPPHHVQGLQPRAKDGTSKKKKNEKDKKRDSSSSSHSSSSECDIVNKQSSQRVSMKSPEQSGPSSDTCTEREAQTEDSSSISSDNAKKWSQALGELRVSQREVPQPDAKKTKAHVPKEQTSVPTTRSSTTGHSEPVGILAYEDDAPSMEDAVVAHNSGTRTPGIITGYESSNSAGSGREDPAYRQPVQKRLNPEHNESTKASSSTSGSSSDRKSQESRRKFSKQGESKPWQDYSTSKQSTSGPQLPKAQESAHVLQSDQRKDDANVSQSSDSSSSSSTKERLQPSRLNEQAPGTGGERSSKRTDPRLADEDTPQQHLSSASLPHHLQGLQGSHGSAPTALLKAKKKKRKKQKTTKNYASNSEKTSQPDEALDHTNPKRARDAPQSGRLQRTTSLRRHATDTGNSTDSSASSSSSSDDAQSWQPVEQQHGVPSTGDKRKKMPSKLTSPIDAEPAQEGGTIHGSGGHKLAERSARNPLQSDARVLQQGFKTPIENSSSFSPAMVESTKQKTAKDDSLRVRKQTGKPSVNPSESCPEEELVDFSNPSGTVQRGETDLVATPGIMHASSSTSSSSSPEKSDVYGRQSFVTVKQKRVRSQTPQDGLVYSASNISEGFVDPEACEEVLAGNRRDPEQLVSSTTFADVQASSPSASSSTSHTSTHITPVLRQSQRSTTEVSKEVSWQDMQDISMKLPDEAHISASTFDQRSSHSTASDFWTVPQRRRSKSKKNLENEVRAVLNGTVTSLPRRSMSRTSSGFTDSDNGAKNASSEKVSAPSMPSSYPSVEEPTPRTQGLHAAIDRIGFGLDPGEVPPDIDLTWKGIWKRPHSFNIPKNDSGPRGRIMRKTRSEPSVASVRETRADKQSPQRTQEEEEAETLRQQLESLKLDDLVRDVGDTGSSDEQAPPHQTKRRYKPRKKNKDLLILARAVQGLQRAIAKKPVMQDESMSRDERAYARNETRIDLDELRKQSHEAADALETRLLSYIETELHPSEVDKIELTIREAFNYHHTDFSGLFKRLSTVVDGNKSAAHIQGLSMMLKFMNGLDYQNKNKRAGELFLHLTAMLAKHKSALPYGFTLENICFDHHYMKNLSKISEYPLHMLMIIIKYGGERSRHNASVLLTKVVAYINQACADAANSYDKDRREDEESELDRERYCGAWVFGEGTESVFVNDRSSTPRDIARRIPDDTGGEQLQSFMTSVIIEEQASNQMSEVEEQPVSTEPGKARQRSKSTVFGIAANAITQFQIASFWSSKARSRKLTTPALQPEEARPPPREICRKCGAEEASEECIEDGVLGRGPHAFESLVRCTPLEFATRLRLPHVVKAILGIGQRWKGVVTREDDWATGVSRDGDDFSCERYVDVWKAAGTEDLSFLNNFPTREHQERVPVLHFILRSMKYLHEPLLSQFVKQDKPQDVKPNSRFWPASYSPGSGKDLDEGSFSLSAEDEAGFEIVQHLLASCEFDRRMETRDSTNHQIIVKESDQTFASSQRGVVIQPKKYRRITQLYDRCGLFEKANHMMGLALLMQKAPTEVGFVFDEGLLQSAPYSIVELNQRISDHHNATPSLLLQCRHLWRCTRTGVEILVYDTELTLLHWLCLIGDTNLLTVFLRATEAADKEQLLDFLFTRTCKLGWTPAHYAVYSDSIECLNILMDTARRAFGTSTLNLVADAPAHIGHTIKGSARQMAAASVAIETLTAEHVENIANILLHDPTTDPSLKSHSPKGFALYGSTSSTGTTPLHLATLFCHQGCLHNLLDAGADPVLKTPVEEMDPHDTAVALYSRMQLQDELKRRGGMGLNETKERENMESALAATINRLHQEKGVQKKLRGMAARYAISQILPHLIFVVLLGIFATSLRSSDDYLAVNAMNEGILREEFIHERNVSLQVFSEIAEFEDLHLWLQGPFLGQLFPGASTGLFLGYWELVGSIRLSQVRGEQGNCNLPSWWFAEGASEAVRTKFREKCYTSASGSIDASLTDVTYFSRKTGREWSLVPNHAPDGNYTFDIPNNGVEAERIIKSLQTDNIIDAFTRAVFIWMVVYNPSTNTFATVTALVEIPLEGTLYPYWDVSVVPSRTFSLSGAEVFFYVVFVIYLLCYTLYNTVVELADLYAAYLLFKKERERRRRQGGGDQKLNSPTKQQLDPTPPSANPLADTSNDMSHPLLPEGTKGSPPGSPLASTKTKMPKTKVKRRISKREQEMAVRSRATIERQPTPVVIAQLSGLIKIFYKYFTEDWNFLDIVCLVTIYLGIVTHVTLLQKRTEMLDEVNQFPPFDASGVETTHFYTAISPVKDWTVRQNAIVAIAFIVHTMKLLKYVTLVPVVGPVVSAIVNTSTSLNVAVFLFVWQFLTVVFAFGLNIILGENVDGYKSLYDTFYTVQRHVLSDFDDFELYYSTHTRLGPFMWLAVTYICHLLLLNLFIAVISVDYTINLATATDDWAWTLLETYKVRGLNLIDLTGSLGGAGMWYHLGKLINSSFLMKRGYPFNRLVMAKVKLDIENGKNPAEQDVKYFERHRHLNDWHVVWPRVMQEQRKVEEHSVSAAKMVNSPEYDNKPRHRNHTDDFNDEPSQSIAQMSLHSPRRHRPQASQPSSRASSFSRANSSVPNR
eukprot:TRINITY_DN1582_c0_g1_i1.p1 TRINITY_DN1582_c0_g1~~TRINITY_DN1582_c0_g1_i1.p1  ORF type:complete len:3353 (+),score=448.06 TRINITY_DN1582_c0_g1_i1:46-10104(+)